MLRDFATPQLQRLHQGKVRDSFRIEDDARLLVATDRLSAFDRVLDTAIPGKGEVLTALAAYWFDRTQHIVDNHMIRRVGRQAMLCREATPVRVEMIVRAYLTGSAWRAYEAGRRSISGVTLPDGLTRNARLEHPIVTPTTKDIHDTEITADAIVENGLADATTYERMAEVSLELFSFATDELAQRGILLVDTKYEFGLINGTLVLIDEIHTPDSSRFWGSDTYASDPLSVESLDKEFVRAWLLERRAAGDDPTALPQEIIAETTARYRDICERITGTPLPPVSQDAARELTSDLVQEGWMKDGLITLVMGSPRDREHADKIAGHLAPYGIAVHQRIASAHKTPAAVAELTRQLNAATEPSAVIAIAGLSNGLGGALAANLAVPVFSCPPFADRTDLELNIHSSLMMPSRVPAATVVRPDNAAHAALRSLNLSRLRHQLVAEIEATQEEIRQVDDCLRSSR